MKVKTYFLVAAAVAIVAGPTAAVALEGGWFQTADELERDAEQAEQYQKRLSAQIERIDGHLDTELLAVETAERATEQLRYEVARYFAHRDAGQRRAGRLEFRGSPAQRGVLEHALQISGPEHDEQLQHQIQLVSDVDDSIESAMALLVHRSQLEVEHARRAALAEVADYRRRRLDEQFAQQFAERADSQDADEQLQAEIEAATEELERKLDLLNPLTYEGDFHRYKGTLYPPVPQAPDYAFGTRDRDDSFTEVRHTGLTWQLDVGTEVRSVADGTVVQLDRLPGYGNLAIVDHGDEYHSIYAHLDEFDVEEGDEIDARELIGRSGQTGSLEGPKLYFELRSRGRPVDPQEWFLSD